MNTELSRDELLRKWVEALRSGKYEQGKEVLRCDANKFCCLGVLADVKGVSWQLSEGFYIYNGGWYERLGDMTGLVHEEIQDDLISMNDNKGKTFPEIADWIEANLIAQPSPNQATGDLA